MSLYKLVSGFSQKEFYVYSGHLKPVKRRQIEQNPLQYFSCEIVLKWEHHYMIFKKLLTGKRKEKKKKTEKIYFMSLVL